MRSTTAFETEVHSDLHDEIQTLRDWALKLRDYVTSAVLNHQLDQALAELEAIPRQLETRNTIRQSLVVPTARIRTVAAIVREHGPNVRILSED